MSDASRSARWSASWGAERGAADGDQPTSGAGRATGDRADGGGAAAGADGLVRAGDERAVLFPMEMSLLWEAQRCLLRAALARKSRSGLLQRGGLEWFKAIPALIRFGHDGQTCPAFPDHLMSGWCGVLVVQVTAQDGHRSHCRSQTARRGHPAADREVPLHPVWICVKNISAGTSGDRARQLEFQARAFLLSGLSGISSDSRSRGLASSPTRSMLLSAAVFAFSRPSPLPIVRSPAGALQACR